MKQAVIFGITDLSILLSEFLKRDPVYKIAAYTLHRSYLPSDQATFLGHPLVAFEDLEAQYPPAEYDLFLCLGYKNMNLPRQQVWEAAKTKGYRIASYVHPTAIVQAQELGEGNLIMEGVILGCHTQIGRGNIFYAGAHVAHHTRVGDFNFFAISCAVAGHVRVDGHCFIGNNSTIRNGVRLADFSLVGAGCYVAHDTKAHSVTVPARSVTLEADSLDVEL